MEGKREVSRELDFYNLDAIIAVGYRVNSYQATQLPIYKLLLEHCNICYDISEKLFLTLPL